MNEAEFILIILKQETYQWVLIAYGVWLAYEYFEKSKVATITFITVMPYIVDQPRDLI